MRNYDIIDCPGPMGKIIIPVPRRGGRRRVWLRLSLAFLLFVAFGSVFALWLAGAFK